MSFISLRTRACLTVSARALATLLLAGGSAALAQEPASSDAPPPEATQPATVEGPRTYTPADFTRFAPQNALDMLRQVPGFVIREATQQRGLGQATGNVLINGERISGKSNDAVTELSQIPAGNVVRIEILDGATLDIPGLSGQVANVVAKADKLTGQFAWQPEVRAYNTEPVLLRGQVSVSGKTGRLDYNVGVQLQGGNGGADGPTSIYGPDYSFIDRRIDQWDTYNVTPRLNGRLTWDGPGSSVANLNATFLKAFYDFEERGLRSGPGQVDRERLVTVSDRGFLYEIGGDYEFALAPGRLKLIGLYRFDRTPPVQTVIVNYADASPSTGSQVRSIGDEEERIARAEYRLKAGKADVQISAEAAFNSLDYSLRLFGLQPGGQFEEIPDSAFDGLVKEDRYEMMASYSRPLSSSLSVQLSAGGEYSHLEQVGEGGLSRKFWRPKGLFSAAWKPSKRLDLNLKLQRRVGQLNFYDFLESVNLNSEQENAGNPDLVPQQSWEADLEGVRNLGAYGSTTLRLYGRLIEDIVDIVPIGEDGESPGNIDKATIYGAEWKTTFHFDPMGWTGAKADLRFQAQRTRVDDPLTGAPRPISNSLLHLAEVSLRHDVPKSDWAWGSSFSYALNSLQYRLTEVGRQWEGPLWASLYAEHKDVMGLTMRATLGNIFDARSMWDRTVYVGRRTGPVSYYERRDRRIGPILSFSVRGNF